MYSYLVDHQNHFEHFFSVHRLLLSLIMLEYQCGTQKGDETVASTTTPPTPTTPTRSMTNLAGNSLEYVSATPIPQQPMFLASILSALQLVRKRILEIIFILNERSVFEISNFFLSFPENFVIVSENH